MVKHSNTSFKKFLYLVRMSHWKNQWFSNGSPAAAVTLKGYLFHRQLLLMTTIISPFYSSIACSHKALWHKSWASLQFPPNYWEFWSGLFGVNWYHSHKHTHIIDTDFALLLDILVPATCFCQLQPFSELERKGFNEWVLRWIRKWLGIFPWSAQQRKLHLC